MSFVKRKNYLYAGPTLMLCHLIPVIISDCASHDIRNTAYSTSLESAISNGSRNLQYTENTAFPNGEQQ